MRIDRRTLIAAFAFACALTANAAAAEKPKIQGVYSNIQPSESQGELIGMEVFIVPHALEEDIAYSALVQFADGVPERPELVDVTVDGTSIEFSVPHPYEGTVHFAGEVTGEGMSGRFDKLGEVDLPRGESIWQWGHGTR